MGKLQIQVLTRDGRKSTYEADRFRNVADLKKRIGRAMNVPMTFSRLTYKGRLLTNESILEDEGVKRMSTLELFWQPLVLTAKQYREKELELEKQDQKQRHVSRLVDNYDQSAKKCANDRNVSGTRRSSEQLKNKGSTNVDDIKASTTEHAMQQQQLREYEPEEESTTSSDDLDFLAAYWCCPKKASKASDHDSNIKLDINGDLEADVKKVNIACEIQNSHSWPDYSGNMLKHAKIDDDDDDDDNTDNDRDGYEHDDGDLMGELLGRRCLGCKHQPFRTGIRLAAGRMSNSIISNIRKNKKNCKK